MRLVKSIKSKLLLLLICGITFITLISSNGIDYGKDYADVIIFSRCQLKMFVYVDGKYVGALDTYYSAGTQLGCGDQTGINLTLKAGKHKIVFQDIHRRETVSKIDLVPGKCNKVGFDC